MTAQPSGVKQEIIVVCIHSNGGCDGITRVLIMEDGSTNIIHKDHKIMEIA